MFGLARAPYQYQNETIKTIGRWRKNRKNSRIGHHQHSRFSLLVKKDEPDERRKKPETISTMKRWYHTTFHNAIQLRTFQKPHACCFFLLHFTNNNLNSRFSSSVHSILCLVSFFLSLRYRVSTLPFYHPLCDAFIKLIVKTNSRKKKKTG